MRYKKLTIFLSCLIISIIVIPFLLINEESPLNRYYREEEAQNLYDQAIESYENKDYHSAISAYTKLMEEDYRGTWGHLYDTECAKNARMQANETLSVWYYEEAEDYFAKGYHENAIYCLQTASNYSPEDNEFYESRLRDMEIEFYAQATKVMEITLPKPNSKNLDGFSELTIINDSPQQMSVYLRGPTNKSITIDANSESHNRIIPPLPTSYEDRTVNETLTLTPGSYEMAIEPDRATGAYGEFKLLPNQSYELYFYILQDYP